MRFLANGGLFVWAGFPNRGYLVSSSGRIERKWEIEELRQLDSTADLLLAGRREGGDTRKALQTWLETAKVVDDVVALGKTPALVVRHLEKGKPRWRLAILGAGDVTWFDVPLETEDRTARLTADANKRGELLLALVQRSENAAGEGSGTEEVLVATVP